MTTHSYMGLDVQLPDGLLPAHRRDAARLGAILADAFVDDPVANWVFGTKTAIRPVFTHVARGMYLRNGMCFMAGEGGATQWMHSQAPKSVSPLLMPLIGAVVVAHCGLGAMDRAGKLEQAMLARRPKQPHLYLYMIGVRTADRGKGLARTLLDPVLAACDKAQLPVYLENSNPPNHGLYASFGFETEEHFTPAEGAPVLEAMLRTPR